MKNNIPCEIIRDVLPSYVDKLTSEVTNNIVDEHIKECKECKGVLEAMEDTNIKVNNEEDKKEIDFLKKNRKKNKKVIIICAAVVLSLLAAIYGNLLLVGYGVYDESVVCDVKVNGNKLSVNASMIDSTSAVSKISFRVADGLVVIDVDAVQVASVFHKGSMRKEYTANKKIKKVRVNARVIWEEGEDIALKTSEIYNTRHDYIGDVSANECTANTLGISNNFGDFTNELQTSKKPYEWKLILEDDIRTDEEEIKCKNMKSYAYILLATIGNLDKVTYKYKVDGKKCEMSITTEEATKFAGDDIKKCGNKLYLLQKLINKTGISY